MGYLGILFFIIVIIFIVLFTFGGEDGVPSVIEEDSAIRKAESLREGMERRTLNFEE